MQKEAKRGASAPLFAIFRAEPSRNQQQAVCAIFAHTGLFLGAFTWGELALDDKDAFPRGQPGPISSGFCDDIIVLQQFLSA